VQVARSWPALAGVFHTVPFGIEFVVLGAVARLVLRVEELRKLVVRRRERSPAIEVSR
jgi:hypothetical protein